MNRMTGWYASRPHRRKPYAFLAGFLSLVLVFGEFPAEVLAEAADYVSGSDEVALEEDADDGSAVFSDDVTVQVGGVDESDEDEGDANATQEEPAATSGEEQVSIETQPDEEDLEDAETDAEESAKTVGADVSTSEQPSVVPVEEDDSQEAPELEAQASAAPEPNAQAAPAPQSVSDEVAAGPELTAQASGATQTITAAGFTLTLPSYWAGKVSSTTEKSWGQNVGTLTNISLNDGGYLVTIHCARRSEFKRVNGWGDVCLAGRKTGSDYIVEVYFTAWPWMEFELYSNGRNNLSWSDMASARACMDMLTGGAYSSCGGSESSSYAASYKCAAQYVKDNILANITLKKAKVTGKWMQSGDRWWYRWSDGAYAKSQFLTISGARYYFDGSGWMVTGWRKISGAWYYFYPNGKMARSAWVRSGSSWYRMDKSGKMVTGWRTVTKKRYWFASSGAMATGWRRISGKWYYFDGSGAMVKSRWVGSYYLQADGTMARSKWIGRYHVNANGVWDRTK